MFVKKWIPSDFSYETTGRRTGKKYLKAVHIEEGVLLIHEESEDEPGSWMLEPVDVTAIRIAFGEIQFWNEEMRAWQNASEKTRRAYIDYIANKQILEDNTDGS